MGVHLNELIAAYTKATLRYCDGFIATVEAGSCDTNRYTNATCNGFIVPLEGTATFSLNEESYNMTPTTIAHATKSMFLRIESYNTTFRYAVIHYTAIEPIAQLDQSFSLQIEQAHQLQLLVQQLLHYEKIPGNLHKLKCKALFAQLIETIFVCAKMNKELEQSDLVQCVVTYLTKHYNEAISIQQMSEELQCDRRRLTYVFEKQLGLSPIQFLTELRIKHAKELLRTTNIAVGDIGEAVGYVDPFYFSRVFKKHAHVTPSTYREQFKL